MADLKIDGLGVALTTPFKEDLSIDYESLEQLIDYVINGGCDYLVALGTTAETPCLSYEEKLIVTKFIKEKNDGRVNLVLGIGGNNTAQVIEEIKRRDLDGYEAILSVTPYYNKPTQEGLYRHYKAISEASPLPVILYNVPGRTGVNLSADTTIRLSNLPSNICGIKEASGKTEQCERIINGAHQGFKLISGDDGSISPLMKIGASGVISVLANAFPQKVRKLVDLCKAKRFDEAEVLQNKMQSIIGHLFEDGNPAGVKALLAQKGIMKNILRLPLVPVSSRIEEKLYIEAEELEEL